MRNLFQFTYKNFCENGILAILINFIGNSYVPFQNFVLLYCHYHTSGCMPLVAARYDVLKKSARIDHLIQPSRITSFFYDNHFSCRGFLLRALPKWLDFWKLMLENSCILIESRLSWVGCDEFYSIRRKKLLNDFFKELLIQG